MSSAAKELALRALSLVCHDTVAGNHCTRVQFPLIQFQLGGQVRLSSPLQICFYNKGIVGPEQIFKTLYCSTMNQADGAL